MARRYLIRARGYWDLADDAKMLTGDQIEFEGRWLRVEKVDVGTQGGPVEVWLDDPEFLHDEWERKYGDKTPGLRPSPPKPIVPPDG